MPSTAIAGRLAAAVGGFTRRAAVLVLPAGLVLASFAGAATAEGAATSPAAAAAAPAAQSDAATNTVPRIAVVSAFEPEWQSLRADLLDPETVRINGTDFVTGELAGKDVVLFLSGVSMVNAAMTTQLALDRFDVEAIVFSGIAGGVDPALDIGDVVVAERWGEYLEAVFARKEGEGWTLPPHAAKSFANYGMIFPQDVEVRSDRADEPEKRFWFGADEELLDVARAVSEKVSLERCAEADTCLSRSPKIVVGGSGVSGMAFVDNADFRKYVAATFGASVLDMESAAVAHVAYANDVPFIAFRSLSDLAGGGEGANEMATFFALASENSARLVKAFVKAMPAEAN
ncbi:5'-methylthioadenosine/S-adenosylhomocysteine nucleosidase [Jiella avicenniae]|uniref:5'-methylthioadenosine/S-adenosylhomocysteine nucleosidase n=1 Tax=Jiella avicenniae TaxID=2907202 RepID=A0A9X1T5K9_9HYPH|nr:5'-methylthioadenosine/S-adenosylhomocysteine nucleosidase [Jiella avicenniae]MCE7028315.1 5'-methylthioadenosine/S-adenosylhomocysteine nucleosidase [Jiella avicenniae]